MIYQESLLGLCVLASVANAYHQYRELKCTTPTNTTRGGKDPATCHLVLKNEEFEDGRDVPIGAGCFKEKAPSGEERDYCDLVCPKSYEVYISYRDQGHRSCFNFFSYQLEKREEEWFLWRSGKCLTSTSNFRIGCKYVDPFKTQYKNDKDIIKHLLRRARRA